MNFEPYLKRGFLKKSNPDFGQIKCQIFRAQKDLRTFALVLENDPEWAATIAYQAMLRAGRALLFSYGFLPADGQQHKTVVEATGEILGEQYSVIVKQFENLRKKRNSFFYDSQDSGNRAEAQKAVEVAAKLLHAIQAHVNDKNPQMHLFPSLSE